MEHRQTNIDVFLELANNHNPTIKFTAEVSDTELTFLDICVYKGERFKRESIHDVRRVISIHRIPLLPLSLKANPLDFLEQILQRKLLKKTLHN